MVDPSTLAVEAAAKALLYLSLLPALGACAARWFLLPALDPGRAVDDTLDRRLARIGLAAALVVLGGLAARAWAHTVAAFGWAESVQWESLRVVAFESRWGSAWLVQVAAASGLIASHLVIALQRQTGWVLASAAGLGLCVAVPLVGHAAGSPERVAVHAAHLVGAGAWVGTLGVVLALARDGGASPRSASPDRGGIGSRLLLRFAPLALAGATGMVASGAIAAWFSLSTLSDLWTSTYGRVLAVKLLVVSAVGGCGYVNWRRFGRADSARSPLVLAGVEVALAASAVLVTSVLTELSRE